MGGGGCVMRRLVFVGVLLVVVVVAAGSALAGGGSRAAGTGLIVYVGPSSPPSLFVTHPASGATRRLTRGSDGDPAWSLDGRRIGFTAARGGGRAICERRR
jgi:Tol biopolymer transport system component